MGDSSHVRRRRRRQLQAAADPGPHAGPGFKSYTYTYTYAHSDADPHTKANGHSLSNTNAPPKTPADTITWNGGGLTNNWSEGANWTGGVVPGSSDTAIFDGTSAKNATIDVATIGSIQINAGYTGVISQASGALLISGGYIQSGGTFNASTQPLTINSDFVQSGGTFNGSSGDIHMNQRFTVSGTAQFTSTTGTLFANGDFETSAAGASFSHNGGTVTFTGPFFGGGAGNAVPIHLKAAGDIFHNVNIDLDDGKNCNINGGPLIVEGTGMLTLTDGIVRNGSIQVQAPAPVAVNANFDGGGISPATLLLTGSASRTVTFDTSDQLPNVDLNASGTTINTTGSGTLTFPSLQLHAGTINQGGADFFINANYDQFGGTFNGSSNQFTENNNFNQSGGTFNGGSGTIHLNENFSLTGSGHFISTTGTLFVNGTFTDSADTATFTHNNGTLIFTGPFFGGTLSILIKTAGESFSNLRFNLDDGKIANLSGGPLSVQGTLQLNDGFINNGVLAAQADVLVAGTFDGGTTAMTFSGGADQTFTNNGGFNPVGTWTINKPSGIVTAASSLILETGQPLNIISGSLYLANGSNLTCGALTVGATGKLISDSATTITLGGTVTNNGVIDLQAGGCPGNDTILLRSTVPGTRRTWLGGAGARFRMVNVDVQDQSKSGSAITVFNGTDSGNNLNWTFDASCPTTVTISPTNVSLPPNGTQTFTATGSATPLTFSIPVNNSGGTINSSTGLYTAGPTGDVTDIVRVTDNLGSDADATVSVQTPVPSQLTFQNQPTNRTAGQTFSPSLTVAVRDQFGGIITTATNAISMAIGNNPGGSTLSGTLTHNAINGVATFNDLSLNRSGTGYTLVASSGSLTSATSNSFNVTAATATQLAFTIQPSNVAAGVSISPPVQVVVQDQFGNLVTTASNAVTIALANNPGGSTLSGTLTHNAMNGVATFNDLSLNHTGTGYTLAVSSSSLTPATSNVFNVTAGAPTKVAFTVQPSNTDAGLRSRPRSRSQFKINLAMSSQRLVIRFLWQSPTILLVARCQELQRAMPWPGSLHSMTLSINQPGTGYTLQATSGALTPDTSNAFDILVPVFLVTNTADSGAGSLRQAILDANASMASGTLRINFNIPGTPPFSIAPLSSACQRSRGQ